jgi:hypothetical protein
MKAKTTRKSSNAVAKGVGSTKMRLSMTKAKALGTPVPQDQLSMPAGFRPDGEVATLKEVLDPQVPTVSLAEVTPQQRADLVAKRIERQPDFNVQMVGAGTIDKNRAIAEVKAQSDIGKRLIEIEQRVLNNLAERGSKGSSS